MAGVRGLLTRVARLEAARAPAASPIAAAFGSFDAFLAWADEQAGALDPLDFPVVVHCLRRWERDGTWGHRLGYTGVPATGR